MAGAPPTSTPGRRWHERRQVRDWLSRRAAPVPDPELDVFRDAIGTPSLDRVVVGSATSPVGCRPSGGWVALPACSRACGFTSTTSTTSTTPTRRARTGTSSGGRSTRLGRFASSWKAVPSTTTTGVRPTRSASSREQPDARPSRLWARGARHLGRAGWVGRSAVLACLGTWPLVWPGAMAGVWGSLPGSCAALWGGGD